MILEESIQQDSPAWQMCVKVSFGLAAFAMGLGITFLPADLWVKGYLAMGYVFSLAASFSLAKTVRDAHEANKLLHKVSEAKTQKILREYAPE